MMLREAGQCGLLHDLATDLESHLVAGLMVDRHPVPAGVRSEVVALRSEVDAFWVAILFPDRAAGALPDLRARLDRLDEEVMQAIRSAGSRVHAAELWLQESAAQVRQICQSMEALVRKTPDPGVAVHSQGVPS